MNNFTKESPFLASIVQRHVLNKPGSKKCTMHVSLDVSGSSLNWKVGDSIGIYPQNSPILVHEIIKTIQADKSQIIIHPRTKKKLSFETFLTSHANISRVSKKWVQKILDHTQNQSEKETLSHLLEPENKELFKDYVAQRELWDFLKEYPSAHLKAEDTLDLFSPLLPRFYSIASSMHVSSNRIDLLIAYFKYTTNSHLRHGVASHYICEMAPMHTPTVPIYIHPSKDFTLPNDPATPILMIGPGTGVAPYKAFIQERIHQKAPGKNWLFYGDWNHKYDFYYQDYWEPLVQNGHLRLSTAFSRDQERKIYVQHKLLEHAKEVWQWLEKGSVFYVCGDAQHMAKDVESTLLEIIEKQGQNSPQEAKNYLKSMKQANRYLRDVY